MLKTEGKMFTKDIRHRKVHSESAGPLNGKSEGGKSAVGKSTVGKLNDFFASVFTA